MKAIFVLPIILVGMAFAQEAGPVPATDLIQWSAMQTPEQLPPAPNARPEPQPETQPAPQPEQTQPQSDAAVHTVTGSISKDGDSYVLKVSDTTSYKLDDQAKAKEFEGQKVRVTGEVDLNRNFIHVQKIEPLA
jgi:hypothetical protein